MVTATWVYCKRRVPYLWTQTNTIFINDEGEIENEDEFETAFENCEDILRNALPEQFDLDPEVEAALVDASLEFSQCMRGQGIDFPDPKPGEFGFFAFRDADIDFSSKEVQEAFEICQPENPLENLED